MAKDQKKQPRPKADTPKGFRDYFGADVTERKAMLDRIAEIYHRHGFDPLETSAVETVEALGKFLPDVDRPNAGVFAWQEEAVPGGGSGDWLALRYDLTAPLARVAAQFRNDLPSPYRRYAMGPVWRNEKPGPGRFRQFYQCDADTVGSASVAADAEICAMLADALEAVGIARSDFVVKLNSRKVLDGVMEIAGLLNPEDPAQFQAEREAVLRTIDKYDRLGEHGVRDLLQAGRRDESGAFIKGVGLQPAQVGTILDFIRSSEIVEEQLVATASSASHLEDLHDSRLPYIMLSRKHGVATSFATWNSLVLTHLRHLVRGSKVGEDGVFELSEMWKILESMGQSANSILIDPSTVRGLGYYTGPVFEAELTFEILDEKGEKRQFGSVAGGGRYDGLVERFTGQKVPATGVSIGVDRLLAALRATGLAGAEAQGPVVVTVMDRDRMAEYQAMAAELRGAGIRAEVYLGNPKNFGNQLKYADKRGAPVAIIQGGDEAERGVVQVKDLILGARLAAEASHEEWKAQPAQTEVPREGLLAEVRRILG